MPQTRRDRQVNYGDRTKLAGSEKQSLAWVSLDESQAITVYATARVSAPPAIRAQAWIEMEWGHGGASVVQAYPVGKRLRVPVAASMVKLEGYLVDLATGKAPPSTVSCELAAFIALGDDGQTLRNTQWITQTGAAGLVAAGPQSVLTVEGYRVQPAAGTRWIMLFDGAGAANGDAPMMATPAPRPPGRFELRSFDARDFLRGVYWATSSTPLVLTLDANARVRTDVELLL